MNIEIINSIYSNDIPYNTRIKNAIELIKNNKNINFYIALAVLKRINYKTINGCPISIDQYFDFIEEKNRLDPRLELKNYKTELENYINIYKKSHTGGFKFDKNKFKYYIKKVKKYIKDNPKTSVAGVLLFLGFVWGLNQDKPVEPIQPEPQPENKPKKLSNFEINNAVFFKKSEIISQDGRENNYNKVRLTGLFNKEDYENIISNEKKKIEINKMLLEKYKEQKNLQDSLEDDKNFEKNDSYIISKRVVNELIDHYTKEIKNSENIINDNTKDINRINNNEKRKIEQELKYQKTLQEEAAENEIRENKKKERERIKQEEKIKNQEKIRLQEEQNKIQQEEIKNQKNKEWGDRHITGRVRDDSLYTTIIDLDNKLELNKQNKQNKQNKPDKQDIYDILSIEYSFRRNKILLQIYNIVKGKIDPKHYLYKMLIEICDSKIIDIQNLLKDTINNYIESLLKKDEKYIDTKLNQQNFKNIQLKLEKYKDNEKKTIYINQKNEFIKNIYLNLIKKWNQILEKREEQKKRGKQKKTHKTEEQNNIHIMDYRDIPDDEIINRVIHTYEEKIEELKILN